MTVISSWLLRSLAGRLDALGKKLDAQQAMLQTINTKVDAQMAALDDLKTEVAAITQLRPAIVAFAQGMGQKLDALTAQVAAQTGGNTDIDATLAAMAAELKDDAAGIAQAITTGTPAASGDGSSTGDGTAGATGADTTAQQGA